MERGRTYVRFTAKYGEDVNVHGSSGGMEPECWIAIDSAKSKNDYMGGERVEVSALLNIAQARVFREGLDAFIKAAEGKD